MSITLSRGNRDRRLRMPVTPFLVFLVCFVPCRKAHASDSHYDLGGPCRLAFDAGIVKQIADAKKSGDWDSAVELEKQSVRNNCTIEYRWFELVNALVEGRRPAEAVRVLEEMDSRGFDLNPALVSDRQRGVKQLFKTPPFKASPAGKKIARLERISDERRARYRALLEKMPASRKPPPHYVAKGACPFECCRYGSWTVVAETELVSAPGSRRVVGTASAGTAVTALTGEVHAAPDPVVVLKDGGPSGDTEPGDLPKGSIAFILDTGGEGYGEVYSRGKILNVFIGVSQYCFEITDGCWGETLLPRSKQKDQVWWIKIRLANGIIGWTNKRYNFGNNDACG